MLIERDGSRQWRSGKEEEKKKKVEKRKGEGEGEEKKKERVETARQGTRCSRQYLKWFFYKAKEGSGGREEQTTIKCEKSWEPN